MRLITTLRYTGAGMLACGLGEKIVRNAVLAGLRAAADWWIEKRLPTHFTPLGARLYGYAPRTAGYLKGGVRGQPRGHRPLLVTSQPQGCLVYSGELARAACTGATRRAARGTSGKLQVRIRVPTGGSKVQLRSQNPNYPPVALEMTVILDAEALAMARACEATVVKRLAKKLSSAGSTRGFTEEETPDAFTETVGADAAA